MESRWRQNVAVMGLVDTGLSLIAHLDGVMPTFVAEMTGDPSHVYVVRPSPDPDRGYLIFGPGLPRPGHFPWGLAVEPDRI